MKSQNETALDRKTMIAALARSAHGSLSEYLTVGRRAAAEDPEFFAHLLAWNHVRGEIRDAKVALPIIALTGHGLSTGAYQSNVAQLPSDQVDTYVENALAHLADLNPRSLSKGLLVSYKYTVDPKDPKKKRKIRVIGTNGKPEEVPAFVQTAGAPTRVMRRFVARYLRDLESDRRGFERAALMHRDALHQLYAHYRVPCPAWVSEVLYGGERGKPKVDPAPGSLRDVVRRLKDLSPEESAGLIVKHRIPFLIARGALGKRAKEPDQVLALIKAMSATELVTNMKWLESAGVKTNPALRSALEEALGKASHKPKASLKASRAAEAMADDSKLAAKLHALQEKQISADIEGDWLVLGDRSPSMVESIEGARQVAAILARSVKGKVHLVFFDSVPRYVDATGKTYEELTSMTKQVIAGGSGTSIGCGLAYIREKGLEVNGIAIASDAQENTPPFFADEYQKYIKAADTEPTVYLYRFSPNAAGWSDTDLADSMRRSRLDMQEFDLRGQNIGYHSLPNLVKTMRVSRYSLLDEVMSTPLRTLDEVLENTKGMPVLPRQLVTA